MFSHLRSSDFEQSCSQRLSSWDALPAQLTSSIVSVTSDPISTILHVTPTVSISLPVTAPPALLQRVVTLRFQASQISPLFGAQQLKPASEHLDDSTFRFTILLSPPFSCTNKESQVAGAAMGLKPNYMGRVRSQQRGPKYSH